MFSASVQIEHKCASELVCLWLLAAGDVFVFVGDLMLTLQKMSRSHKDFKM